MDATQNPERATDNMKSTEINNYNVNRGSSENFGQFNVVVFKTAVVIFEMTNTEETNANLGRLAFIKII